MKLVLRALLKYGIGLLLVMLLVFVPAGALEFVNGWIFIGLLFIPMLVMGIVMLAKNPSLLEKRLNGKETESEQKAVVGISGIMFLAGFVVAGLNYRFGWQQLPLWMVITASGVFFIAYLLYAEVMKENTYLSRTIEVQQEQKIIDTGLYGIVRHPMYFSTLLMFLSIPLILGSLYSFLIFLIYPFVLVVRIRNEESVLEKGLEGYTAYKQKVKYRLIPFVW